MADELIPLDRQRLDVLPVLITFLHTFRLWDHARDEDSGDSHMQSAGLLITDSESDSSQDAPFLLPFWPSQISVVAPPRMPSPPACSAVQHQNIRSDPSDQRAQRHGPPLCTDSSDSPFRYCEEQNTAQRGRRQQRAGEKSAAT